MKIMLGSCADADDSVRTIVESSSNKKRKIASCYSDAGTCEVLEKQEKVATKRFCS